MKVGMILTRVDSWREGMSIIDCLIAAMDTKYMDTGTTMQKMSEENNLKAGYISGCTTSLDTKYTDCSSSMKHTNKTTGETPGVFMMVVPAETVEDTLDELLQFCVEGDIIIDHGNSNFKDSRRRAERLSKLGIQYLDCGTSGGVYGLERGYCLMVGGSDTAVSACRPIFDALAPGIDAAPRTDDEKLGSHLLNQVGYVVAVLAQVICKDGP